MLKCNYTVSTQWYRCMWMKNDKQIVKWVSREQDRDCAIIRRRSSLKSTSTANRMEMGWGCESHQAPPPKNITSKFWKYLLPKFMLQLQLCQMIPLMLGHNNARGSAEPALKSDVLVNYKVWYAHYYAAAGPVLPQSLGISANAMQFLLSGPSLADGMMTPGVRR